MEVKMAGTRDDPLNREPNCNRPKQDLYTPDAGMFVKWIVDAYMGAYSQSNFKNLEINSELGPLSGNASAERRRDVEIGFYELVGKSVFGTFWKYNCIWDNEEKEDDYINSQLETLRGMLLHSSKLSRLEIELKDKKLILPDLRKVNP
jgi:hypothetical protein